MSITVKICKFCNETRLIEQFNNTKKCEWCLRDNVCETYEERIKKMPSKNSMFMKKVKNKILRK
jgi:hypothetical protein